MDKVTIKTVEELAEFECNEPIVMLQQLSDERILLITRTPIEMMEMAREVQVLRERLASGGSALRYIEEVIDANPNGDESLLAILKDVRDILKGKVEEND